MPAEVHARGQVLPGLKVIEADAAVAFETIRVA